MTDGSVPDLMRKRPLQWWRMLAVTTIGFSLGLTAWWGCTSTFPDQSYGDPTGLRSQNIPGEGGVIIVGACEAGLPADILAASGGGDGGSREGGAAAGGCKVSYSRDLHKRLLGDGGWRCGAPACHGGSQPPVMDMADPDASLASLRKIALTGLPYIAPETDGGGDPVKSSIYCNLARTCGSPMPPSPALEAKEVCALETWLRCGAPSN
jgi:hypothetical protein